jgi:hypothetical protein
MLSVLCADQIDRIKTGNFNLQKVNADRFIASSLAGD